MRLMPKTNNYGCVHTERVASFLLTSKVNGKKRLDAWSCVMALSVKALARQPSSVSSEKTLDTVARQDSTLFARFEANLLANAPR